MPDIVLTTLNAKWIHASFGLRCLYANLGPLQDSAIILEGTIEERPLDIAERILQQKPKIVGIGVYVWNTSQCEQLVATLKRIANDVVVVLGGPEVSFETGQQHLCALADHVICGEGELAFADLCRSILGHEARPEHVIQATPPDLQHLASPYPFYKAEDLEHRIVYVEASRGCPFACEFCLSSLDERVRPFPLAGFLDDMDRLLARGLLHFKFVDRTFNLSIATSSKILEFFLQRQRPGLFLHFEMIPDRLPEPLKALLARFPPGMVQLEVGIQTFDAATSARISRVQDITRVEQNLTFLKRQTGVHIHADLIVGLPGEDAATFAAGFDRLIALAPHEIQVGILKRLRGTPITRHDQEHGMVYAAHPPYEILATHSIPFDGMQDLRRFARVWDLLGNSGNFAQTAPLLWRNGSPFSAVMALTRELHARFRALHGIALHRLAQALFEHLVASGCAEDVVGAALFADFHRTRPNDWPEFLRPYAGEIKRRPPGSTKQRAGAARRQARHPG